MTVEEFNKKYDGRYRISFYTYIGNPVIELLTIFKGQGYSTVEALKSKTENDLVINNRDMELLSVNILIDFILASKNYFKDKVFYTKGKK